MINKDVLFLIPQSSMSVEDVDDYVHQYPHIAFAFTNIVPAVNSVRQRLGSGIEIVAARAQTAESIRNQFPQLHVIEIPVSPYDIIRTLIKAKAYGKTVAIITNRVMITGFELFASLYQMDVINYMMTPYEHIRQKILNAVQHGASCIIGSSVVCDIAKELNVQCHQFPISRETMTECIQKIAQLRTVIDNENIHHGFMTKMVDNISEGIITTDNKGVITAVNTVAERMLKVNRNAVLGKSLRKTLDFFDRVDSTSDGVLVKIHGSSFMLVKSSIVYKQKQVGTIFTLHEQDHLEKLGHQLRRELYAKDHCAKYTFGDVFGYTPAIVATVAEAKRYAQTDTSILITGESGTGKEMFAQSIHNAGKRSSQPFVAVNCAALHSELLQSELFGYVEGAFTGAKSKGKAGLFEVAHGGTLFLDEIGEMDYQSQGKLLRCIEERYVMRLGSNKPIPIDVRIIAATNKNLLEGIRKNSFREDLYYRLNILQLIIPPLRQRNDDIIPLLIHFLHKHDENITIDKDAQLILNQYKWPGNIRELYNISQRIIVTYQCKQITSEMVTKILKNETHNMSQMFSEIVSNAKLEGKNNQKKAIADQLKQCGGNISKAARELGIDRSTLWRRMHRPDTKG